MKFPGTRFTGNGTDIDNRCGQELVLDETVFESSTRVGKSCAGRSLTPVGAVYAMRILRPGKSWPGR